MDVAVGQVSTNSYSLTLQARKLPTSEQRDGVRDWVAAPDLPCAVWTGAERLGSGGGCFGLGTTLIY